jgi:hypothetical protein
MFSENTFYHPHTVSLSLNEFIYMCFSASTQGDVYPVESYESFSSSQILDAHWGVMTDGDVRSCVLMTLNCLVLARDEPHLVVLISLEAIVLLEVKRHDRMSSQNPNSRLDYI